MSIVLSRWLGEHRDELLQRWEALLEPSLSAAGPPSPHASFDHQRPSAGTDAGLASVAPNEDQVILGSLYDGLVHASHGDFAQLDETIHLLRALRARNDESQLASNTAIAFRLRRAACDLLSDTAALGALPAQAMLQLSSDFDELIEYMVVHLIERWVTKAQQVEHELNETRQLVESLYHDAAETDRTTLHVSRLNELSQALASSLDESQQLALVGSLLIRTLPVASLTIWQQAEDGLLRPVRAWRQEQDGDGLPTDEMQHWSVAPESADLIAQAWHTSALVASHDDVPPAAWNPEHCYVVAMPLVAQGKASGVIVLLDSERAVLFDRTEQEFLRSAASQAAISIANARLYDEVRSFNHVLEQRIAERTHELQFERDTLETLNAIALEISSTLDEHLLMEGSLNAVAGLVGASHGSIRLLDRETDQLLASAILGEGRGDSYVRFPVGRGVAGWVAQHRKTAVVSDVTSDPRWIELPGEDEHERKSTGSMLVAPLIAHHELQGVLVLSHETTNYFREEHQRLVEAAANQIATGIHNALVYKQLELDLLRRYEMQQTQEQAVSQSNAILQSLSDGVIVCDVFGSVITVNPSAEHILERPLEELLIWNMPELIRRMMGRRADELPIEELLNEPCDAYGRAKMHSATLQLGNRVVSATLNPVLSSEKQTPMGALLVFRDITREVEADRLKTEFIGTVSHELRTPMTSIKGFTQLLVMGSLGPVNETQREFLNIIQTNSERMIAIINDLLDITKIETGSVELDMRPLHVAEAISTVVLELQPRIQERGHELAISIPPGLPLVLADQRRFNQILFNMFSNAVKYTPRNGQITLEAHEVGIDAVPEAQREGLKSGQRYVQIDVRDTGVGIAAEDHDRVFERFYRAENPLKVEAGGTGLGLSLVRPLLKLFGGRIWVTSTLGEGSTFSLVVPAC
jgi:signal transduction histidine kinase/GAF domain-containing protein